MDTFAPKTAPPQFPPPDPHNPQALPTNRQLQTPTHRPRILRTPQPTANHENLPHAENSPTPAARRGRHGGPKTVPPHLPPLDLHDPQDPPTNRQPQGSTHRPENLRVVQPIANPEDLPPDEQSPKPATRRGITETSSRPSNPPAQPPRRTWASNLSAPPRKFPRKQTSF